VYRTVNRVNGFGFLNFLGRRTLLDTYNRDTVIGAFADASVVPQHFLNPFDTSLNARHGHVPLDVTRAMPAQRR
jgi:hypothetical protein